MEGFFSARVLIPGAIGLTIAVAPLLPAFFAVGRFVERTM
jgi:hypothetical protein